MMVGIIDYGASNLRSVCNALDHIEQRHRVCTRLEHLVGIDILMLPGVGQFSSAIQHLRSTGLDVAIRDWVHCDKPTVCICLGLQLLFAESEEAPNEAGLGLFPGMIGKLHTSTVPHIGWNRITATRESSWLPPAASHHFYFAHSFVAPMSLALVSATVRIDDRHVPAVIECGALRAVQFHPEKSATAGLALLKRMLTC